VRRNGKTYPNKEIPRQSCEIFLVLQGCPAQNNKNLVPGAILLP